MKHTFFKAANWLAGDPRRIVTVALVVLTVLAVTLALVPGTPALAGEITSGS
ncbi:MAG: hypothetical protein M5U29_03470 [Anaerolineae bacterium]|nr:hypothetical protein [Anaerolineae bacterium]